MGRRRVDAGPSSPVTQFSKDGKAIDTASARTAADVTTSDVTIIEATRGLYVGVSGDVRATMVDGGTVTFVGLAAGIVHPISVVRIFATSTDATNIIALY